MIGCLKDYWRYSRGDLWGKLARTNQTPGDLFIVLYRLVIDYLNYSPSPKTIEEALNDPTLAKKAFQNVRGRDFRDERSIILFLEASYVSIKDLEIEGYANRFKNIFREFLSKYNLRYRIEDPFSIRLHLPGAFSGIFADLGRINQLDPQLSELMADFEHSFGAFARSRRTSNLKTCIAKASNYAEGVAAKSLNVDRGTLGRLCDDLQCWPHDDVKESLKKLYGFCSDYPGIRHAGNRRPPRRNLEPRDAVLVTILLIAFSGYLTEEIDLENIIGI